MIVYLNGALLGADEARVSVFDRGFLFGDGVYEGLRAEGGRVLAIGMHAERLGAGLRECRIGGFDARSVGGIAGQLLEANGLSDAFVYVQVTRGKPGVGEPVRSRVVGRCVGPTVFAYAEAVGGVSVMREAGSCSVALVEDTRWTRGHVKGVSLLGNVIGAMEAAEAGAEDAVFVRGLGSGAGGGVVSEGVSTNVFALIGGEVVTPSLGSASMLGGVTRRVLLESMGGEAVERRVTAEELRSASEVSLVGTRTVVKRVSSIDGEAMGEAGLSERLLGVLRGALLSGAGGRA